MTKTKSTSHSEVPAGTRRSAGNGQGGRSAPAHAKKPASTKQRIATARPTEIADAPSQRSPDGASKFSPDEIRALVAGAAYFRAEARGFAPGHELDDWFAAEVEISERLARGC